MSVYVDVVRYRELFGSLFRRDLQARYKGTVFGVAWSLANPLLLMAIYFVVFSVLWKVSTIEHYPLYLLGGLAVWIFVSASLTGASRSMVDYADLIKKVKFPRQLVALSVVATQLVPFTVMLAGLDRRRCDRSPRHARHGLLSIPIAAGIVLFAGGLRSPSPRPTSSFVTSSTSSRALLLPWFFLTPILYSLEELPGGFEDHQTIVDLLHWANPLTPQLYALRAPLFYGELPAASDTLYLVGAAIVSLALGALVFRRIDDRIAVEL